MQRVPVLLLLLFSSQVLASRWAGPTLQLRKFEFLILLLRSSEGHCMKCSSERSFMFILRHSVFYASDFHGAQAPCSFSVYGNQVLAA